MCDEVEGELVVSEYTWEQEFGEWLPEDGEWNSSWVTGGGFEEDEE